MPATEVSTTVSIQKQARLHQDARIYPVSAGDIRGLEDEIRLLPLGILEAVRRLHGGGTDAKLIGGEIESFSPTGIVTRAGYILTQTAVYFLEALNLTPNENGYWGFYELELNAPVDADPVPLDFWDESTNTPYSQSAAQRRAYRVRVYENYETTAAFPALTPGRIKWIEYKRVSMGGSLDSVLAAAKSFFLNEAGELILPADPLTAEAATTRRYVENNLVGLPQCEVAYVRWLSNGTNGGASITGAWRAYASDSSATMTLDDPSGQGFAAVVAGKIRLQGGYKYLLDAQALFHGAGFVQIRLWNTTTAALAKNGLSLFVFDGFLGLYNLLPSSLSVRLAPLVDTDYELQYRASIAHAQGLGLDSVWGENEFALVRILKFG